MNTLTVGVIGAGRVGRTLAAALSAAGHRVTLDPSSPAAADLLLLTVPDDALAAVAAGLSLRPDQVVAHTSGAYGLAVLAPAGGRPLALHPAMTFTGDPADVSLLPGISYGVTAPDDLRPFATRLVADLGGTVEWIAEPDRPLYHAALSHGANHLVTLVNEAADLLREAGVREPQQLLAPLLAAALDNALRLGDGALTGPVARGDAGTIARHLAALGPAQARTYRALARRTADRAIAAGTLSPAAAERLLAVLAGARSARAVMRLVDPPVAGRSARSLRSLDSGPAAGGAA
jgi:predicted short-subunit dehydrogenase-like oxidoreductase (DUF2520 family)